MASCSVCFRKFKGKAKRIERGEFICPFSHKKLFPVLVRTIITSKGKHLHFAHKNSYKGKNNVGRNKS